MAIRPVEFSGIVQRSQDMSALKQNEDNKPMVQQQNVQTQFAKETIHHMHQVNHANDSDNDRFQHCIRILCQYPHFFIGFLIQGTFHNLHGLFNGMINDLVYHIVYLHLSIIQIPFQRTSGKYPKDSG